jgi:phosphoribosyl 1,2-cyclic phosphodiesterase
MRIISLSSGSKANVTLVVSSEFNLLIDVGGSMKSIEYNLMVSEGLEFTDISYILITHAHTDHIQALNTILNRHDCIKILTTLEVFNEVNEFHKGKLNRDRFIFVKLGSKQGGKFELTVFPLHHDKETVGFMINDYSETYVHICDNGGVLDKELYNTLNNKEYYSIESNHDLTLQINDTTRHEGLKRRVLGWYGHSSNDKAMDNAFKLMGDKTKAIQFTHLSEHCNSEELARLTHTNLIKIWGKVTEFKSVRISYALQNEIVEL